MRQSILTAISYVVSTHMEAIKQELKFQMSYEKEFDGWEELYPKKNYTHKDLQKMFIGGMKRAMEMAKECPHFNDTDIDKLAERVEKIIGEDTEEPEKFLDDFMNWCSKEGLFLAQHTDGIVYKKNTKETISNFLSQ